jgi:hypothetical protein
MYPTRQRFSSETGRRRRKLATRTGDAVKISSITGSYPSTYVEARRS